VSRLPQKCSKIIICLVNIGTYFLPISPSTLFFCHLLENWVCFMSYPNLLVGTAAQPTNGRPHDGALLRSFFSQQIFETWVCYIESLAKNQQKICPIRVGAVRWLCPPVSLGMARVLGSHGNLHDFSACLTLQLNYVLTSNLLWNQRLNGMPRQMCLRWIPFSSHPLLAWYETRNQCKMISKSKLCSWTFVS
jgi:hypothetical protein